MTSAQPNGNRPTTTKLLSDLFNIKSSVLELHQNNQRVVDKIQEKVAKSQSLLKEELDCQRLLVRAQPTGQDKQETSLVTHREDNLAKRKPRHSAEFEVEQTTERTTLNFLASYREPTVRIGSGCEPSAYCFAKKQTRATHDGLHKYRSAATLQPYRENEVSKTDILSTQSKSPNISAQLFRNFEIAISGMLVKVIAKCSAQMARLQSLAEAVGLRVTLTRSIVRRNKQQHDAKCREVADLKLRLEDYQKQIQMLGEHIGRSEKRIESKEQELADTRKHFSEMMDTFREFKEDYRLRIKSLEDQLNEKNLQLANQSKQIAELNLRIVTFEGRYSNLSKETEARRLTQTSINEEEIKMFSEYKIQSKESLQLLPRSDRRLENSQELEKLKRLTGKSREEQSGQLTPEGATKPGFGGSHCRRLTIKALNLIRDSSIANKIKQSDASGVRSKQQSTGRLSREDVSFNLSADGIAEVTEFSLEDLPKLQGLSLSTTSQVAIYGRFVEYAQRLRAVICEKNRFILHLGRRLLESGAADSLVGNDGWDVSTKTQHAFFRENFSEGGRAADRPPRLRSQQQRLENQSLEFISSLLQQIQNLEAELETAERNEQIFLGLKENYVKQIDHLRSITERYQQYYEAELKAKSGDTHIKRPRDRDRSPRLLRGRLSPLG